MDIRKLKPAFGAVLAVLVLGAVNVHAEGLYAGGSIGAPHFGDGINGIDGNAGGISGKAFGGYQFNSSFAVEGGIATLGRIRNINGTVHGHGAYLDAIGLLPLGANFSLLGSVGVSRVNLDTSNGDDRGTGLKLGLGGEYALGRNLSLRGEYENYHPAEFGGHPSIGQYTLGVRVSF